MPNRVRLLIEMQDDPPQPHYATSAGQLQPVSQSQVQKIGHVFQGRYKSMLCQTDRYLGELVKYIHLNPVRAKMVKRPERYEHSVHR